MGEWTPQSFELTEGGSRSGTLAWELDLTSQTIGICEAYCSRQLPGEMLVGAPFVVDVVAAK